MPIIQGELVPNAGEMGMDYAMPQGTGRAQPYGLSAPAPTQGTVQINSMGGGTDSALSNIGYRGTSGPYRPEAGRADRLGANIVGGTDFDNMASGGYAAGATHRM
jgi:hypothetical protein